MTQRFANLTFHPEHKTMRNSLLFPAIALATTLAASAVAQTTETSAYKSPGMVGVVQTTKATATITAIDAATREVTLKGPQGNTFTVVAEPDVKNFAALKTGDKVQVQYVEALSVELVKGGKLPVARTSKSGMETAPAGAQPGGSSGAT